MNLLSGRVVLALAACGLFGFAGAAQAADTQQKQANGSAMSRPVQAGFQIAAGKGYCNAYAKKAVNAQKKNQRQSCGFRGARWQANEDRHYQWCLRVSRSTAESESRARQRQLQSCRQGGTRGGNAGYCNAYAKRAVNAQKQNQRNSCGFRGARWQSNFDNHYNWCMRVPRDRAEAESRARQRQLQGCK